MGGGRRRKFSTAKVHWLAGNKETTLEEERSWLLSFWERVFVFFKDAFRKENGVCSRALILLSGFNYRAEDQVLN